MEFQQGLEQAQQEEAIQEAMRQDSIRQAIERREQALVYGPPPPSYNYMNPEKLRDIAAADEPEATSQVLTMLMDYCYQQLPSVVTNRETPFSEDSDLKIDAADQQLLLEEIERRCGVQLSPDMLSQLATPRRIAQCIVKIVSPIKKDE